MNDGRSLQEMQLESDGAMSAAAGVHLLLLLLTDLASLIQLQVGLL